MNAPETFVPRSSNIARATFDPDTDTLTVKFASGDEYDYMNVPMSVYRAFTQAPSAGQFFYRHIRDRYPYDGPK